MDKPFSLEDYGINQAGNTEIQDELADHVKRCFNDANLNKRSTGVESRLLRNLRANKCEYQPDEIALLGPYNDVYMGIPALKARAAESWLTDIILNNIEKPWTLDPTPRPDLPEGQLEEVVDMLLSELPTIGGVDALKERASELKGVQQKIAYGKAEKATGRMEELIADQMAEGDWSQTFAKIVADIVVYPTCFMRGPIVVSRAVGSWNGDEYKAIDQNMPTTRTISPFDAYPSPDASSAQDGEYFIEKARFKQSELYALIDVDGFNAGNVRQVIDRYENGYSLNELGDSERERLEDKSPVGTSIMGRPTRQFETLIYNGRIRGKLLADHGIIVKDRQKAYECEIWLVGEYVVRAILNPSPTGARPIYSTSYRKVNGSAWGQSVIDLTYDIGRVCNAAARNLVRNMGYSAGPIGEVVGERVTETQDPTDIQPYRIVMVGPDMTGTGAPAYKFHNVGSIAKELMEVFNQYMKYADDMSGVPSYVLGNPQVAGAGRTLGGLSMLMGNAAKGIKNVQLNIDRDVITGIVSGFYVYNMVTSDDDSIKADCKIIARGATGLLQRELAQTRTIEILQLLAPYIEQWDTLPDGIKILLREILKTTGLPIDDIIADPNKEREGLELAQMIGRGAEGGMSSAQALQTGMNNPPNLPPQSMPQLPNMSAPVPINMAQGA